MVTPSLRRKNARWCARVLLRRASIVTSTMPPGIVFGTATFVSVRAIEMDGRVVELVVAAAALRTDVLESTSPTAATIGHRVAEDRDVWRGTGSSSGLFIPLIQAGADQVVTGSHAHLWRAIVTPGREYSPVTRLVAS